MNFAGLKNVEDRANLINMVNDNNPIIQSLYHE